MIEGLRRLKRTHGNVGHTREVRGQFSPGVTTKRDPAAGEHGGEIAVLEQHVRPGRPDALLANNRIIVRCRQENRASHATGDVFDPQKGDVAELETLGPQQRLYIVRFRKDRRDLGGLLQSFLAASNKNLFQVISSVTDVFARPNDQNSGDPNLFFAGEKAIRIYPKTE